MKTEKEELEKYDRLYPTEKEERIYRELKKRYGFKDALIVKSLSDKERDDAKVRSSRRK